MVQHQKFKITGKPTTVGNSWWAKLSYYSYCVNKSFKNTQAFPCRLDFHNFQDFSQNDKKKLIQFCKLVHIDKIDNHIFHKDQNIGEYLNEFIQIFDIQEKIAKFKLQNKQKGFDFLQNTEITSLTIMLYKQKWVKKYFQQPMKEASSYQSDCCIQ